MKKMKIGLGLMATTLALMVASAAPVAVAQGEEVSVTGVIKDAPEGRRYARLRHNE